MKSTLASWVLFVLTGSLIVGITLAFHPVKAENFVTPIQTTFGDIAVSPIPVKDPGVSAVLPAAIWVPQTFNNCGPAATAMALQYFGFSVTQEETKAHLRTNADDKNVFIWEIADYLQKDYSIQSKLLYNGDISMMKKLIANGFYIMVEDWLHPNEDIGHVLIIRGFDDTKGVFIADDSYLGVGMTYPYQTWDATQWKPFNREYMPLYRKDQEALLKKIIDADWDKETMYRRAVEQAQKEIDQNPMDMYAYFNLGTSLYALGDFTKADDAFETSRTLGWPKRMLWYQIQPIQTKNEIGRFDEAITLADMGLWANDTFAELHAEKAKAYRNLGNENAAQQEMQKAHDLLSDK